jgi:hypothetical protein
MLQIRAHELVQRVGSAIDVNQVHDADAGTIARAAMTSEVTVLRRSQIKHKVFGGLQRVNGETGEALTLEGADGKPTPAARILAELEKARAGRDIWFEPPKPGQVLYVVTENVDMNAFNSGAKVAGGDGSRLAIYWADPGQSTSAPELVAPAAQGGSVLVKANGNEFAFSRSGATSFWDKEATVKVTLHQGGLAESGAPTVIKAKDMDRDPSAVRRALSHWFLTEVARVPTARIGTVKWFSDGVYEGVRDMEEPPDLRMWEDGVKATKRPGAVPDDVWIFKANWLGSPAPKSPGPQDTVGGGKVDKADLRYLGDDGTKYLAKGKDQTYDLQTNKDKSKEGYNALATFVKTLNGIGLSDASGARIPDNDPKRFNTDAYRQAMESTADVYQMLRSYAALNLAGCWDNLVNPSNFAWVAEKGKDGVARWSALPIDLDSSWGLGWDGPNQENWADFDILVRDGRGAASMDNVPVIWKNLLANDHFKAYVLDYMDHLLKTSFNKETVRNQVLEHWGVRENAVFQESDSQYGPARTGRPFTNDQMWKQTHEDDTVHQDSLWSPAIPMWVGWRNGAVAHQLAEIRQTFQNHAGVDFDAGELEPKALEQKAAA